MSMAGLLGKSPTKHLTTSSYLKVIKCH
ncbi:hypothetical protein CMEL01_04570 [Colletotrichum melonis]|uniref:Uncharacterized protein n=1 Tax=Colletotrichum melonis TaxID=1209925 RepID=A0AAI9UCG5_9PEZI|nr:hypothetical protein CMEL01_04570 [Colletotrichum melonis]